MLNYPGPLLEVEWSLPVYQVGLDGLCIALIRPNHWAASVAQWLEHLSSKQCVVGSNPTRAALFSFSEKKELFGLVAFPFFLFIEKSFHVITQLGVWCHWWFNYPGPLLEVEWSLPVYQDGLRRPLYSFDSTQPLGCLSGSVVRASV